MKHEAGYNPTTEGLQFRFGVICLAGTVVIFLYQLVFGDVQLERSVFAFLGRDVTSITAGAIAVMSMVLYLSFMLRTMQALRKLASMNVRSLGGGQLFWPSVTALTMPVGVRFVYPRTKERLNELSCVEQ